MISDLKNILYNNSLPLIKELHNNGLNVKSVWDISKTDKLDINIINILLKHLKLDYHLRVKEGIARLLAIKNNKNIIWDTLIEEYIKAKADEKIMEPGQRGYKDGLAEAISYLANKNDINTLIDLIKNKEHGKSRILLADKLFKYKNKEEVYDVINNLKEDVDLKDIIKLKFNKI